MRNAGFEPVWDLGLVIREPLGGCRRASGARCLPSISGLCVQRAVWLMDRATRVPGERHMEQRMILLGLGREGGGRWGAWLS